ncbi:MAG: glycosyltransferase [Chloroflexi bacterium]|nr:glycosyltransferase [Chloroflexota bacterium]
MRVLYLCLSPSFGMHQYTADLANRMVKQGLDVHLITTANHPRDRYSPALSIHTPIANHTTGFSPEGLNLLDLKRVISTLDHLTPDPFDKLRTSPQPPTSDPRPPTPDPFDKLRTSPRPPTSVLRPPSSVHITAPHLWNPAILRHLRRRAIPTLHTLHDLDPHPGTPFGALIRPWNRLVQRYAGHIQVHGHRYQQRLVDAGYPSHRITTTALLHLFLSHKNHEALQTTLPPPPSHRPAQTLRTHTTPRNTQPCPERSRKDATRTILFFGRLLPYKGLEYLLAAMQSLQGQISLILAGPGDLKQVWDQPLPQGVQVRDHLVEDEEALALFRQCSLVVLPYVDATQSALIAAAYYFYKPVIATRSGALPEYVVEGETGWLVPPGDVEALARTLSQAIADPQRLQAMGRAARAWYDRQCIQEQETLTTLYENLANR